MHVFLVNAEQRSFAFERVRVVISGPVVLRRPGNTTGSLRYDSSGIAGSFGSNRGEIG